MCTFWYVNVCVKFGPRPLQNHLIRVSLMLTSSMFEPSQGSLSKGIVHFPDHADPTSRKLAFSWTKGWCSAPPALAQGAWGPKADTSHQLVNMWRPWWLPVGRWLRHVAFVICAILPAPHWSHTCARSLRRGAYDKGSSSGSHFPAPPTLAP